MKALQVMVGTVLARVGHGNGGTYLSGLWRALNKFSMTSANNIVTQLVLYM